MSRWLVGLAACCLLLITGCSENEQDPYEPSYRVFRVPDEFSFAAAIAASESGDKILLTAAGSAVGHFELPAGVSLYRHGENPDLFEIAGSLSSTGFEGGIIEGLKIVNAEGSGLVLRDCELEVTNCWIKDCAAAGVELVGRSDVYLHNSDFENCKPGVLIRDVVTSGHHDSDTAPRINSNNFIANRPILADVDLDDVEESLGPNLVFSGVAAGDTVSVSWNWWGAMPGSVDPEDTIWDHKDHAANNGLADTLEDYFPSVMIYPRDWRD